MQSTGQGTSSGQGNAAPNVAPMSPSQRAELEALKAQIAALEQRPTASELQTAAQERYLAQQHKREDLAMGVGAAMLFPLVIAVAIRIMRRGLHKESAPQALEADRLARLEQAVDAIAVEVE